MPAIFAHELFGRETAKELRSDLKNIIRTHYTQFRIGLQGPDLFFFYRPYSHNQVNQYGTALHESSALPFLEKAKTVISEKGRDSREYAYLLGFICHFILDSECHPYVESFRELSGVAHMEIEEEFDKKLLRLLGRDPFTYPLYRLVPTDEDTARAILPFYDTDFQTVRTSLLDLRRVKRLFYAPRIWKQFLMNGIMKLLGKYDTMKGLIHQRPDNPRCAESSQELLSRFKRAVPLAVRMLESFDHSLQTGSKLDSRFDRNFE